MDSIHKKQNLKGFTLIELLIVLAIIAILATVMTISISAFRRDSMIERANENAKIVGQAIQEWITKMEIDGIQYAKPNPDGTSGKYMTITSNRADMQYTDTNEWFTLDGVKQEQTAFTTDAERIPAMNTLIVKDYQPGTLMGTACADNGTAMGNGLDGKRLTGMVLDENVERNLGGYLKNSEMEAMNHSWLCVIDTESNTVLYTTWLDEIRIQGFTNNEQRYRECPVGGTIPGKLCEDTFYKTYGRATGCYPFVEEMGGTFS